jgi:hypothetical protein
MKFENEKFDAVGEPDFQAHFSQKNELENRVHQRHQILGWLIIVLSQGDISDVL